MPKKLNQLAAEERRVIIDKGTERPFTGKYNDFNEVGLYLCKQCDTPLYRSQDKFQSSCGWPSFDESIPGAVEYVRDTTFGMIRTEILCANCGSHLGHVFDDGPTETGQRYCVNSASIDYDKN